MGDIVSLVRVESSEKQIKESIAKALDLISCHSKTNVKSVVIKPNLCYYWNADTGYTTDPRVVAGIIDWVRERHGFDTDVQVVEADATAMRTKHAFLMLGYEKLAREKNVRLFNLCNDKIVKKTVSVGKREISFKVPSLLLNSDLFINVPKLKIMRNVEITCALKNVFGCIASPRKVVYHKFLDEAIVGINKVLHPDLTIVDGLVALGRFPVKLGLLMASVDSFSIDWVASQIMGHNPSRIRFLRIAMSEHIGNPKGVTTLGESMAVLKRVFPKEPFLSLDRFSNVFLGLFRLYAKIVKDVVHPSLEETLTA